MRPNALERKENPVNKKPAIQRHALGERSAIEKHAEEFGAIADCGRTTVRRRPLAAERCQKFRSKASDEKREECRKPFRLATKLVGCGKPIEEIGV